MTVNKVILRGWRTLIQDQELFGQILYQLTYDVTEKAGMMVRTSAMTYKPWNDDTYDTRRSMNGDPIMYVGGDSIVASIGPTTPYSNLLEYGWSKGGTYYVFPFMIPAAERHEIDFINGLIDAMGIAIGDRPMAMRGEIGTHDKILKSISKARAGLYSIEKALGDIIVITGSQYLGPLRSGLLFGAKELGDISAVMNKTIGARIGTRITGSLTGRALGMTRTVSVDKTYTAYPGGGNTHGVGSRVYNRVAGRATRPLATGMFNR